MADLELSADAPACAADGVVGRDRCDPIDLTEVVGTLLGDPDP